MKVDWVAEFFSAMRDCGEDISIVYGLMSESSVQIEPRWFELPHDKFDGVSGLADLLRNKGCYPDQLPILRGEDNFTFLRALRGFFTFLPELKIRLRQWRQFDNTKKVSFFPVKERVAWQLFSKRQTGTIVSAAKKAGVTVNTYLMFHLDAVVASQLVLSSSVRHWMIPVNLRGAVTRETENSPHMSFLGVDLDHGLSLSQLQEQINELKKQAYHWGAWIMLNAGKLLGAEGMRKDMRNRERKNHGWTGIFSNLGVWEIPCNDSWVFCPAISRAQPVGAGCITMNSRMALTLQLHEALGQDLQASYTLLKAWKQACLKEYSLDKSISEQLAVKANSDDVLVQYPG